MSGLTTSSFDELQPGHIKRFETTTVVGYLYNDQGRISAVSGACTHLGCLLLPAKGGTNLEGPCHRATFAPDGKVLSHELMINLPPLPAIASRLTGTVSRYWFRRRRRSLAKPGRGAGAP